MPGKNLTRSEARERARVVHGVERYDVTLDLASGDETFVSETTLRFRAQAGASTFLDLVADSVELVELNGSRLNPAEVFDDSRVLLTPLSDSNTVRVLSTQRYTNTGEGLHRFVDPADDSVYLYTQFEIPDSRQVFAVFEQPDIKSRFAFTVVAPAEWRVVSTQASPEPVSAGVRDGRALARWEFEPTPVLSSYVTAIVAGPYAEVRSELVSSDGRAVPLGLFCRASLAPYIDAAELFQLTRQGFEFFEREFGIPYPFDKYDQLFVPEHSAGAMENVGAVTFDEYYLFRDRVPDSRREGRAITLLHELAHMWFGNLVTMRWWNDLWLNESFADYVSNLAAAEATRWSDARATFAASDKAWALRQDQLPTTHPIAAEVRDIEDTLSNFDGITYAKGAAVLGQLICWVGREPFMRGMREYFLRHRYSNTELPDLLEELERQSGRSLAPWAELWLETSGVNTLLPVFELDSEGHYTRFTIQQTAAGDGGVLRPHRIAVGLYEHRNGSLTRTRRIELDIAGEHTAVPELTGERQPDLLLINDDDLSFAKVRLDERSLATAQAHLGDLEGALARALVWGSLWDATRDAELPATRFIKTVLAHAGAETNSTTLHTLLEQLDIASASYTAPERRERTAEQVADGLWSLAAGATAGSDQQLQFTTAYAASAVTAEQLARVSGILAGTAPITGLTVTNELGWELLTALVAGGIAGEHEIDARLALDRTSSGELAALQARASRPTPAAKHAAWEAVFDSLEASNHEVEAIACGFSRAHDRSLIAPFVTPFHDAITEVWETRAYSVIEQVLGGFYPATLASSELAEATRSWLAQNAEAAPTLRRLIAEPLADLDRTLAAQWCDRNSPGCDTAHTTQQ